MELQGFGASLVGRAIYVYANSEEAWVPWEFISGVSYSARILVRGTGSSHRIIEMETDWNIILSPQSPKDWSMLATLVKGNGGSVLLVFDADAPKPPTTFLTFLDGVAAEGRTILTRVWVGQAIEIPCIPDAVMFPVLSDSRLHSVAHDLLYRLPARDNHGIFTHMNAGDWASLVKATVDGGLGIMITDVGETAWSLFWHKIADSQIHHKEAQRVKGLALMRTGMKLLERA